MNETSGSFDGTYPGTCCSHGFSRIRMADAMMENPIYQITNRETAMAYFRANALTRLTARRRA